MSENTGEGISRDEALEIAARKLQARRVQVTDQYPPTTITTKEHSVAELVAAHYEKALSKLPEGKWRDVLRGVENLTYDGPKVVGWGVGAADIIAGGLFTLHGIRGSISGYDRMSLFGRNIDTPRNLRAAVLRPLAPAGTPTLPTDRLGGAAKLLGGIGILRYMPVTAVARTALNVTL